MVNELFDVLMKTILSYFVWILICLPLAYGIFSLTGAYPHYSIGERNGYITKISISGVVFKTNEGEMQIGTGQQAALQAPFAFSVADTAVFSEGKAICRWAKKSKSEIL